LSLIYIEVNQLPLRTQSQGIDKALLVEVEVILISGLIKITNINTHLEWSGNKWAFSANGVKPNQMIGNQLGSLGVTVKYH